MVHDFIDREREREETDDNKERRQWIFLLEILDHLDLFLPPPFWN